MELALNILWLALSCAAFAALAGWCACQPRHAASRRRQKLVGTSVTCLVALLFPIISITDDLSHDVLLVEASVKRRASHDTNHHERIITAVAVGVVSVPTLVFDLSDRGAVIVDDVVIVAHGALCSLGVRAPPLRTR
jgi:hypothetical protein